MLVHGEFVAALEREFRRGGVVLCHGRRAEHHVGRDDARICAKPLGTRRALEGLLRCPVELAAFVVDGGLRDVDVDARDLIGASRLLRAAGDDLVGGIELAESCVRHGEEDADHRVRMRIGVLVQVVERGLHLARSFAQPACKGRAGAHHRPRQCRRARVL